MLGWWIEKDGVPVPVDDALTWAKYFASADRVVAQTTLGRLGVSTVFLGIDHNFSGVGPPLLYETMTFGEGVPEEFCARHATRVEAFAFHERVVEAARLWGFK